MLDGATRLGRSLLLRTLPGSLATGRNIGVDVDTDIQAVLRSLNHGANQRSLARMGDEQHDFSRR